MLDYKMKRICVIGSLNVDLVTTTGRFVNPGETVTGYTFNQYFGGKGANQAIAAGRLGADVSMFGKVGSDSYGREYLANLKESNVNACSIEVVEGVSTGIAVIEVESSGDNRIIIVQGANGLVDKEYIGQHISEILEHDIFLLQLEIPISTVIYIARLLKSHGKTVILDPAPARELPDELLNCVDYLTPNETELKVLSGTDIIDISDLKTAGSILHKKGVECIIHKAGKNGAYIISKQGVLHIPGFVVETVDTTAAGDTFNAGFAFGLSQGFSIEQSVHLANAAGALSTTGKGAQGMMPSFADVKKLMNADQKSASK